MAFVAFVSAQKQTREKSCWEYYQEEPESINEIYFPHPTNCRFYYQCSAHGKVRMKCQPGKMFNSTFNFIIIHIIFKLGMHFDVETNQCGRPDDVVCGSDDDSSNRRY